MNALVANYLFVEGFRDAAENFSREAGISPSIDLGSIESRMEIKQAVQRGDVEEATELVNDLDPEVSAFSCLLPSPPSLLARNGLRAHWCLQRLYCTMHHSQGFFGVVMTLERPADDDRTTKTSHR